jgi:protein-L-isoaspartate(D-aspartate) O-methyltransferase
LLRQGLICAILAISMLGPPATARTDEADYAARRAQLVQEIAGDVRRTARFTGRRAFDERVTAAMGRVKRHLFVPKALRLFAYRNRPLPIGHGQTISQPYMVALMTDLLDPAPGQVALEVGTGSGYQAAVLAELGLRVFTMEIIAPLAKSAAARLEALGYRSVTTRWGDGYNGWPEHAPYDAIIVTAASDHIPPPLIAQLKPGGRMVIPVGARFMTQQLVLIEKDAAGKVRTRQVLPVVFVPLTRTR